MFRASTALLPIVFSWCFGRRGLFRMFGLSDGALGLCVAPWLADV